MSVLLDFRLSALRCIASRILLFTFICFSLPGASFAQDDDDDDDDDKEKNFKPKIKGQQPLSTSEEDPITIEMWHLEVEDKDDVLYPIGFTMQLYAGTYYSFSGHAVTPEKDFTGTLTVPVTVNDGKDDSEKFDLKISVSNINDPPVITGQQSLGTTAGTGVKLEFAHLSVRDPDNAYPADFIVKIQDGENYSVSGNEITPEETYVGPLVVPIIVNDGKADSERFNFTISVAARSTDPVIKNQVPVIIREDESFALETSHLIVSDPQNNYPQGFSINISAGEHYQVSNGTTIVPAPNYYGNLFIPVTVTNGQDTSDPYTFQITVRAVNDAPVMAMDTSAIRVRFGDAPVTIFTNVTLSDVDNDSLTLAEVSFPEGMYIPGTDILNYPSSSVSPIKGLFDSGNGILALIGKASIQDYVAAISSVVYQLGAGETSGRLSTAVRVYASDGQANSRRIIRPVSFSDLITGSFEIPTGFTPNGDAVNDTWSIRPLDNTQNYDGVVIRVYSKSGLLVFEGTGINTEWDGKYNGSTLPPDVYFYTVDFNLINRKANLKGIVTILR